MGYNGPVRFYLVHGYGIYPSDYVAQSPYAIVEKDWRVSLPEMASKYPLRGESLEVDCHGDSGTLRLYPEVTLPCLHEFASVVRGLLRPSGTVEFLACNVANFDAVGLTKFWKHSPDRESDIELVENLIRSTESWDWGEGRDGDGRPNRDYRGTLVVPSYRAKAPKRLPPDKMDYARIVRLALATAQLRIGDSWNGPLFCSRAAQALRCTVRASMAAQPRHMTSGMGMEEFLNTPNYRVPLTGNWQGHVFDFAPAGSVSYVGFNVPRPVFVPMTPETKGMC